MRTNVVLDDQLVREAKDLTGITTTRAVLDEALRTLVRLRKQAEIRSLRGTLNWEGNLMALRESRVDYLESDDNAVG